LQRDVPEPWSSTFSGEKSGAHAPPSRSAPLTEPSLLSRGTHCVYGAGEVKNLGHSPVDPTKTVEACERQKWRTERRGDSRPRLSPGAGSAVPAVTKPGRASLDWTAEGGCPHVVCGRITWPTVRSPAEPRRRSRRRCRSPRIGVCPARRLSEKCPSARWCRRAIESCRRWYRERERCRQCRR